MNRYLTWKSKQRGINLLEVLVGIAIFALGMLALAHLQGSLARSSNDANARTVAINLAEETIESLRAFSQVEVDPAGIRAAFNDIASSTAPASIGGIDYTVATVVTDYYFSPTSDDFETTPPAGVVATDVDLKLVEMTVSWDTPGFVTGAVNPQSLGSGSITISDVISSFTTLSGAKVTLNATTTQLYAPPVDYDPGQNPEIIAIQLGDNKFKESTTPLPDIIRQNELTETKFDVVTYLQDNAGATFLRREEFLAVSCECNLRTPSAADDGGRRPTVWDGEEYTEGEYVFKTYGESANNQQSIYCDLCCRDHHDGGTGSTDQGNDPGRALVNPFRDSSEYWADGNFEDDHKHYRRDITGALSVVTTSGVGYVEACRMIRKDGFFRVAQDLRQEGLNSFPEDYLDQETEIGEYSSYVTGAVAAFETDIGGTNGYENNPPTFTEPQDMVPPVVFPASTYTNATLLPTPRGSTSQQLRARGIYVDYLSDDLRTIVNCLDLGGTGESCGVPGVSNSLEVLPFYDVQLTWLARWTETPTNNPVDVSNEAIADDNSHSRGLARLEAGSGYSVVDSEVHSGNLGLTGTDPISPGYAAELRDYDLYVLANDSSPPPATGAVVRGDISSSVAGVKAADVEITATGAQCDRGSTGFECHIESGAVEHTLTVSNYEKLNRVLYACSDVLVVQARSTSTPHWTRFILPADDTSNAHIVIRDGGCG
jgi:type II secretory pathway pseudopilin PulG